MFDHFLGLALGLNLVLRVSKRKISKIFATGAFFRIHRKALILRNPCPEKFQVTRLMSFTSECLICGALRDLVAFVQFKKREKHPWKSVNFSKVAG